jgi:hypothetical protein
VDNQFVEEFSAPEQRRVVALVTDFIVEPHPEVTVPLRGVSENRRAEVVFVGTDPSERSVTDAPARNR